VQALRSPAGRARLVERLPVVVCVLAAVAVVATTGPVQTAAWVAFAITAGWLAWRHRRPSVPASAT